MKFNFASLQALEAYCQAEGFDLRFSQSTEILSQPLKLDGYELKNRFCVHPMEGSDAGPGGSVSRLVTERYKGFAKGGSALIWFEAVSVLPQGRAGPNQLLINKENLEGFKKLIEEVKLQGLKSNGFEPKLLMQLTHSGRFSKPEGLPKPIIAYHHKELDKRHNISEDLEPVSDAYLDSLPGVFAKAALMAQEAGFDGVDIKCCHRYLLSELLSAYERKGKYGGSLENRAALLFECVEAVRSAADPGFIIGSRLNGFDALPGGFACSSDDYMQPDLGESIRLVKALKAKGVGIFNITTGSPYYNSFVNRPNDVEKDENPLLGVSRMFGVIASLQEALGSTPVVGTGYSYLRNFIPYAAAGEIAHGRCSLVGLGRMSLARPNYPKEIMKNELPPAKKLCTTCGKCAALLRAGRASHCVVFDRR